MFDKDTKDARLKTTGVLTLLNQYFYLTQLDLSNLEQLILILNSLKREADALSNVDLVLANGQSVLCQFVRHDVIS